MNDYILFETPASKITAGQKPIKLALNVQGISFIKEISPKMTQVWFGEKPVDVPIPFPELLQKLGATKRPPGRPPKSE